MESCKVLYYSEFTIYSPHSRNISKVNDNAKDVTADDSIDQYHPSSSASTLQAITFYAGSSVDYISLLHLVVSNARK